MRPSWATCLVLLLTSLCGCQQSPPAPQAPPPPQAFRVQGRLFVDNQLAAQARIAFCPVDEEKSQGRRPVAMTRRDGSFELTTYAMDDGAPEGDYRVTVTWPDESMPVDECECPDPILHDRLSGKYANPETTELLATVLPRDNNIINLSALGARRPGTTGIAQPKSILDEQP